MSPEEIARKTAEVMWAEDKASAGLGMVVEEVKPGEARLSMTIRPDMVNGHGIAHGGFIFLLADSAFAFACNAYNQRTVAQHCAITFLAPGKEGMRLVAVARERQRAERSGIYDITVSEEGGAVIAEFRGHSRTLPGTLF